MFFVQTPDTDPRTQWALNALACKAFKEGTLFLNPAAFQSPRDQKSGDFLRQHGFREPEIGSIVLGFNIATGRLGETSEPFRQAEVAKIARFAQQGLQPPPALAA